MSATPIYDSHEIHYDATNHGPLSDQSDRPFQPTRVRIAFRDGQLSYVSVSGLAIRKDGSIGSSERYRMYTERRQLTADIPGWVREFVDAALAERVAA